MSYISSYLSGVKDLISAVSESEIGRFADLLEDAWRNDSRVLLMGNGGSSSTASHIVNDLQKCIDLEAGRPLKTICLTDCTPLVMAWANDTDYANVFAPQVKCWVQPGDLVIGISGSGNSMNVINAIETANGLGAHTIGLAGYSGGKLAQIARECIVIRSENMQQIEDLHMIILHVVFSLFRDRVRSS